MRFISTRMHGFADYLVGIILVLAPWIFGFANGGFAQWVPVVLGLGVIFYSLITDYELGIAAIIPMPVHLGLDIGGGALLAISPWLFAFADEIIWPHLVIGLLEIAAGLTTRSVPDRPAATGRVHTR